MIEGETQIYAALSKHYCGPGQSEIQNSSATESYCLALLG